MAFTIESDESTCVSTVRKQPSDQTLKRCSTDERRQTSDHWPFHSQLLVNKQTLTAFDPPGHEFSIAWDEKTCR